MRIGELLLEKDVESSWIGDISNKRKDLSVILTLHNGRRYMIRGMSRHQFDLWHNAPSKGKYFHKFVNGFYDIIPI